MKNNRLKALLAVFIVVFVVAFMYIFWLNSHVDVELPQASLNENGDSVSDSSSVIMAPVSETVSDSVSGSIILRQGDLIILQLTGENTATIGTADDIPGSSVAVQQSMSVVLLSDTVYDGTTSDKLVKGDVITVSIKKVQDDPVEYGAVKVQYKESVPMDESIQ